MPSDLSSIVFVADRTGKGANEIYLTHLATDPVRITAATEGNLRLRAFDISRNGETLVYRRDDVITSTPADLSFIRNADPATATRIMLPAGLDVLKNSCMGNLFAVSPDGGWIAVIGNSMRSPNLANLFLLNVDNPGVLRPALPAGASEVSSLRFSQDSKYVYFLAWNGHCNDRRAVYRVAVNSTAAAVRLSAPPSGSAVRRDIEVYAIAPDQSKVIYHVRSNSEEGIYFVDPTQLATEFRVSHPLPQGARIDATNSTTTAAGTMLIAYSIAAPPSLAELFGISTYVAEASPTPDPRLIVPSCSKVAAIRPDGAALLYTKDGLLYEASIGSSAPHICIGEGDAASYDYTGNSIAQERFFFTHPEPTDYHVTATVAFRETFGTSEPVGTPGLSLQYRSYVGIDRGVMIIGEGPPPHQSTGYARMALVNLRAPGKLVYVSDLGTPFAFRSPRARFIGP